MNVKFSLLLHGSNIERECNKEWRTLLNDEVHILCSLYNITVTIKSRRIMHVGHIAQLMEIRNTFEILVLNFKKNVYF